MMLTLLLSCAAPPTPLSDDARLFAQLLAARDASRCLELRDPELQGQCQNANGMACEQIVPGPWQRECFFSRGEAELAAGEHEAALADCQKSGDFATECFTHLFKAQLEPKLDALQGDFSFVELTAEAQALADSYGTWGPPWGWWWRRLHAESSPLDRARCEPLEQGQRRSCQREAVAAIHLAWREALALRPRELCQLDEAELRRVVQGDPRLDWRPNADLDAAVREELSRACD